MKSVRPYFSVIVFLLVMLTAGSARSQHQYTLTILGLDEKKGTLLIGWYDSAENFRKADRAVISRKVDVNGQQSANIIFENINPGTYAIAVFFDRNGDGKLDTNVLGIPKEKYGFSNNVYPAMRAARFSEAAFEVTGDGSQVIRLK
ncbi:MAG: DUF2141 domain-containing protein [Chitinophagaceae bacterium]|nr:DUF2141 domain-containing protein [Chitinophagaceae bacterium]